MTHPNQLPVRRSYRFQGLLAIMVVALATAGGYAYFRASEAASPYIGVAATPNGTALKLQADGCVNGGGPVCNVALNKGVTGLAAYGGNNGGYWVVAGDGGVFAAGGAPYGGSMSGKTLTQPVRAIAGRAASGGYWLLGGDGGVFAFNGAPYYGGGNQRVGGATDFIGIASSPSGNGYWLLRASGGVYPFGDAAGQNNSTGGGATGIAGGYGGSNGYWVVHSSGAVTIVGAVGNAGNIAGGMIGITRLYSNSSNCLFGINGGGGGAEICPTPTPTITASPVSIAYGAASTISWSSTSASTCSVPGIGSGTSGSHSTGVLTASHGYNVTCSNDLHGASRPVTVSVAAAPAPNPTGGGGSSGGSGGSTGSSGGSSGTSTSRGSATSRSSSGGSPATPDTIPPTLPGNFTPQLNSQVVNLTWSASTDNVGVDHYELDRSLDQTVWNSISSSINATTYTDQTVGFGTTYYYRLRAVDGAGNDSDYATAQITTGAFTANSSGDNSTTIMSDDKIVTAVIPASAFSDQADCSIINDSDHADKLPLKKTALITGPYSLLCKKQDGSTIDNFSTAVAFSVKLTSDQTKRYRGFTFYSFVSNSETWSKFKITYTKKTSLYSFSSTKPVQFAVLGSVKKGLSAQAIILIIMFILLIAGVVYYLYQRAQKQSYQEYIRKKYYNL